MKHTVITSLNVLVVLSLACTEVSYCITSLPNDKSNKLYLVRKIFIEEIPNIQEASKVELFLKRELQRWGFIIIEDRAGADAILTVEIQAEVILDGDGSVPNKAIYKYELRLTDNELVWKGKIKFPARQSFAEENEYAAQKIAEKIANAWRKTAKKGAGK
jgi:hypothetical protein